MTKMVLRLKGWKRPDRNTLVGVRYGRETIFFEDPTEPGPLQEVDVVATLIVEKVSAPAPRILVVDEDDGYCD